jgi:protein-disulfide isomerase
MKNGYYRGNKNARIVIAEYSDLICPFCKRHYSSQTIEQMIQKYPNDVAMIFKNMPLAQLHPTAPLGARGAECAGKLGGASRFYDFIDQAFKADSFTDENVLTIAKSIGLNEAQFTACYNDPSTVSAIQVESQEGQTLFGINGTPGNVVIDRQTGKYFVIAGAYPVEEFESKINALLGK